MPCKEDIIEDITFQNATQHLLNSADAAAEDKTRPNYHFAPLSGWMNDPNGCMYVDGWYHLFYLQDPFSSEGHSAARLANGTVISGTEKPNRYWGHARSRDMLNWEHLPIALRPDRENGELKPISGCTMRRKDGNTVMLFTAAMENGNFNVQRFAVSNEKLIDWTRIEGNTLTKPVESTMKSDWRDPYIFEYQNRFFMLVSGTTPTDAQILIYEATTEDLLSWEHKGCFLSRLLSDVKFFECPRIFETKGYMVLTFSPYQQVEYYAGLFDVNSYSFEVKQKGVIDASPYAYATDVCKDEEGVYLISWIPGWECPIRPAHWYGCLSIPRKVEFDDSLSLIQKPVEQMQKLRSSQIALTASDTVIEKCSNSFELKLEFKANPEYNFKIDFLDAANGRQYNQIEAEGLRLSMGGYSVELQSNEEITLHCFADRSVFELFVCDRSCITYYTETVPEIVRVELLESTGSGKIAQAWKLAPSRTTVSMGRDIASF